MDFGGRMKVGEVYKTVGGWEAQIIWICGDDAQKGFYAVHKPRTEEESIPIYHLENGNAHSVLSVNTPPRYNKRHPADIVLKKNN